MMATFRDQCVFFFAILILACPQFRVSVCQSDAVPEEATEVIEGTSNLGFGIEDQDFGGSNLSPAPGVDTAFVFPKNNARLVTPGEETELLVGLKNDGEFSINIIAIRASLHLPFDRNLLVQNLTTQTFDNATVPAYSQATFPYIFAVSKYLQPGTFDLEGAIIYEIEQQLFQSSFFNSTIEVTDSGGFLTMETVLLVTFGVTLLAFFGLWVQSQVQYLTKKSKKVSKLEMGTGSVDESMDEWLKGTAYTQSMASKTKKKNK